MSNEHAEEAAISDRSPVDHERAGDERGEQFAPVRRRAVRRTAPMTGDQASARDASGSAGVSAAEMTSIT